jgi:hypothetical protein
MDSESYFYVCNGAVLKDLEDLLRELNNMDDGSFYFHVNSEKNDFYNWVNFVLQDSVLAKKMQKVKDRKKMIDVIEKRLRTLAKSVKRNKNKIISQIKGAF